MKYLFFGCRWGLHNEELVYNEYIKMNQQSKDHIEFLVTKCGFIVNKSWPFIGASPDGILNCECCGRGVLEIKCPYSKRDMTLLEAVRDTQFCLAIDENNQLKLKNEHSYYYQVQMQMHVSQASYCDFVLWTRKGFHVERILPDVCFFNEKLCKAQLYFRKCILPEIVGKCFSKPKADCQAIVVVYV